MRTPLSERAFVNGKYTYKLAMARARKFKAFPRYANTPKNRKRILQFYIDAQMRNLTTRKKWHIDHMIPLYHPLVCGLHVPENLRILSKVANEAKSNNFVPYREKDGRRYYYQSTKSRWYAPYKGKANPTKKSLQKMAKKIIFRKRNFTK